MERKSKIYVAGHRGLVGSAIVNNLISKYHPDLMDKTVENYSDVIASL